MTGSCSGKDHSVTGIDNYICLKYDTVGHRVYFYRQGIRCEDRSCITYASDVSEDF